jgi:hypothetical protein
MTDDELRKLLLTTFEYSYLHEDWVFPLSAALAGVDAEGAQSRLNPDTKTIWEIVLHVAVWNENIVARVNSGNPEEPEEGPWPQLPGERDEAEWQLAKARLTDSILTVRNLIQSGSLEAIRNSPWGFEDLACRFNHMAYHIGQITVLTGCLAPAG